MVGFCLAMMFNTSVWLLPVIIFGLRITGQGMSTHIAMVAMARWFTAARGKAIAIAALGFSVGEAFLPKIFAELLPRFEWRVLWLIPVVIMLILIPTLRVMLAKERTPQSISESEQSAGIGGKHWTRGQAFRSWVFWGILPVFLMPNAFGTALFFQQVHLAETKGWGHSAFVTLFPLYTGVGVLSALVFGGLIDRYGCTRLIKFVLLPMAVSFAIFAFAGGLGHAAIAFVCLGVMAGGTGTASVAFWPEVFGTRHIGSIKAMAAAIMVIASAIGPVLSGYFIDQGVAFHDQMVWIAVLALIVAGVAWITSRAIYPKIAI
jgi:MFS family permease